MCQPGRPGPHGLVPRRLAGLGGLPQREVERAPLVLAHLDARAGLQVVDALPGQGAVAREPGHGVVDVAFRRVGQPARLQALDDVDHLGDVLRGARLDVGRRRCRARPCRRSSRRRRPGRPRRRSGPRRWPLRMILSSTSVMLRTSRTSRPRARRWRTITSKATRVRAWPDVAQVVDRDAADVDADLARLARLQIDLLALAGVVDSLHGEGFRRAPAARAGSRARRPGAGTRRRGAP